MTESNDRIKQKVSENLEELRKNLKDPTAILDSYLKKNLKVVKEFMNSVKSLRIPTDPEEITNENLRTYYENKIRFNYYSKVDNDKPNLMIYLGEIKKALEDAFR